MTREREALIAMALRYVESNCPILVFDELKKALAEERNFCPRCGKRLASGFVEISIHTCTPPQPEEEQEIKDSRTPEERRDAGQWHCSECFTFGYVHKRGCVTANKEKNT